MAASTRPVRHFGSGISCRTRPSKECRRVRPRGGDGSLVRHRLCGDLVDNVAAGHGGAASIARHVPRTRRTEIWSPHARLSTPQAYAGHGSLITIGSMSRPRSSKPTHRRDPRAAMRRIAAEALAPGRTRPRQSSAALGLARVLALSPSHSLWYAAFWPPDLLPKSCQDPVDDELRRQLDAILHHHALAVWVALDLLAYEWRSEKIGCQLDALDGLASRWPIWISSCRASRCWTADNAAGR